MMPQIMPASEIMSSTAPIIINTLATLIPAMNSIAKMNGINIRSPNAKIIDPGMKNELEKSVPNDVRVKPTSKKPREKRICNIPIIKTPVGLLILDGGVGAKFLASPHSGQNIAPESIGVPHVWQYFLLEFSI